MTTITLPRATIELAIEALETATDMLAFTKASPQTVKELRKIIELGRAALEQPQAEPAPAALDDPNYIQARGGTVLPYPDALALLREARDALVGMGVFGTLIARIDALLPRSEGEKT